MEVLSLSLAKVRIIREISKKFFEVVDMEDTAVTYLAALAGGKYLYVPPGAVKRVTERNDVTQFQNRAVGFAVGRFPPNGGFDCIALIRYD